MVGVVFDGHAGVASGTAYIGHAKAVTDWWLDGNKIRKIALYYFIVLRSEQH